MSKIEWTDETWNPVVGCTKCSPGCDNCYAEKMAGRLACMGQEKYKYVTTFNPCPRKAGSAKWLGKWNNNTVCDESALERPLHWKKPRQIFVCSMGDLFHPSVPFEFIDKVMAVIIQSQRHTFQILTKRPKRMKEYFECVDGANAEFSWSIDPDPNIWLGVTVCNQKEADEKIPILLQTPAAVRFISIEPCLGEIDIKKYVWLRQQCVGRKGCGFTGASYEFNNPKRDGAYRCPQCGKNHTYLCTDNIDWVICGGESGPGARPMHPGWARSVRDQCKAAGVPFFFKQWGEYIHYSQMTAEIQTSFDEKHGAQRLYKGPVRIGKKKAGHLLDGNEIREYPK